MSAAVKLHSRAIAENPSVLVVEDEALIRMAIADSLKDDGFTVLEAGNALDAVRLLESDDSVELVFSDISMPGGMDGTALADWVHTHRPGMPILLTSGSAQSVDFAANEQFFAKPYDMPSVVECIRRAVESRRA
jgi:DNA-binding NtrC family response regulator